MKREDAFRKVRTICQRLDELDIREFTLEPYRLYLFGSVLTDKPDPKDINLILTYEHTSDFDAEAEVAAMIHGRPTLIERLIIHLRRGILRVRMDSCRKSLGDWVQREVFLGITACLIWEPSGNWEAALDRVEASPRNWPGPLTQDVIELFNASIRKLSKEEREARLSKAIAEIEAQDLPKRRPS